MAKMPALRGTIRRKAGAKQALRKQEAGRTTKGGSLPTRSTSGDEKGTATAVPFGRASPRSGALPRSAPFCPALSFWRQRRRGGRGASRLLFALAMDVRELLPDPRRLARARTQVVELRAADVALALDLDRGDQRRIRLERPLHTFAARDLAHDERRVEAAVALGDHDALVGLDALALAFDDAHVDDHGVAGRELGDGLAEPRDLFLLQRLNDVHLAFSDIDSCPCRAAARSAGRPLMRAVRCHAEPMPRPARYSTAPAAPAG